MPTRPEVDALRLAQAELSKRVRADLAGLARSLTGSPQAIRDLLMDIVPTLVAEYGDVAATISAEWFEEVYGTRAVMAAPIAREFVEQGISYTAGHLFEDNQAATVAALNVKLDAWIKQPGRDTVRQSAARNNYAWARVPSGAATCSFCTILASRGAVYDNKQSAGDDGHRYHGGCDCQVVAVRDDDDLPDGYNPDELYEMYSVARDEAGSGDIRDIAAAMRRTFPNQVTDAVHTH